MGSLPVFAFAVFCVVFLGLGSACEFEGGEPSGEFRPSVDGGRTDFPSERRWSSPIRIAELGSPGIELFPSPSRDGHILTFVRTEVVGTLFVNVPHRSLRPPGSEAFGPAVRFQAFGNTSIWDLEMRDDELEWFFWTGLGSIAVSSRETPDDDFSAPVSLGIAGLSPSISGDGLALYYLDLNGNVMVAYRSQLSEPWQPSAAVDIDIPFSATTIDISRDQRTLLITAEADNVRAGIYTASRPSPSDSFNQPARIDVLEGPFASARFGSQDREIFMSAPFLGSPELYRSRLVSP